MVTDKYYSGNDNKVVILTCAFFGVFKYENLNLLLVQTTVDAGLQCNLRGETHLSANVLCIEFFKRGEKSTSKVKREKMCM